MSDGSTAAVARAMASASASITARHVVERAVSLHVLKANAFGVGNGCQSAHLVDDEILDLLGRAAHLAPAEPCQIRKPRVRANRDAVGSCQTYGLTHHARVARMESAGHVCRGE